MRTGRAPSLCYDTFVSTNHEVHHSGDPGAFVEHALACLRAEGKRVTKARRLLLDVLARHHEHLTADEIADLLREGGVHRVTVYRTLDTLIEVGAVTHVQSPGGAAAYHLTTDSHVHGHCIHCHKVVALPTGVFNGATQAVLRSIGFSLDVNRSSLLGVCIDCRANGNGDSR